MLHGSLHTVFGWHVHVGENPNPRSLRNFVAQANGAEMKRVAACLGTERGVEIGAPIHDAFLICAPIDCIDAKTAAMRTAMIEASRAVLDGFELRVDIDIVRYPDRYMDPRGEVMWNRVQDLIAKRQQTTAVA
jgi:DNA polymerase-1